MDEDGLNQRRGEGNGTALLERPSPPETEAGLSGGPPHGGMPKGSNAGGSGLPRRWIVLAVVAALLLLAGILALVLTGGGEGGSRGEATPSVVRVAVFSAK